MYRSPASVYLDTDFYYCPDPMSYSTTWKNFQPPVPKPKRGLPIVSEDSKEEESDRDVRSNRHSGKEIRMSDEVYSPRSRTCHISKRLLFIVLFSSVCGFLALVLFRYQSLRSHQPPSRDSLQKEKPSFPKSIPKNRLYCKNSEVLSQEPDGSYFYSLETVFPFKINETRTIYGFYQAFSETGKLVGSPKISVLEKTEDLKAMWKAEEKGSLDSTELVDHYVVIVFLDQNEKISKLQFDVHCPETEIRRQIKDSNQKANESHRQIDDSIVQALICILCFVLGAIISKWMTVQ